MVGVHRLNSIVTTIICDVSLKQTTQNIVTFT
jgi:hypothetical protein